MKLVFGLGNPGKEYHGSRHNVGLDIVSRFAKQNDAIFHKQTKFKAEVAEYTTGDEKVLLVMPLSFYNLVGESYRLICDYYKIAPEDTLVVHDELALPFGTLRTRSGGSDAGNNGVKSIIAHGGTESHRLRVGVSNELQGRIGDVNFVLGRFSESEASLLNSEIIAKALTIIDEFISDQHHLTTHTVPLDQ